MGEDDINVHDQWACESMGAIQDRTREHLGTTDKVIMANRRMLQQAIDTVEQGGTAPGIADPALARSRSAAPTRWTASHPRKAGKPGGKTRCAPRREGAPWHHAAAETVGREMTHFAERCGIHTAAREAACVRRSSASKPAASSSCAWPGATCTACCAARP